MKALVICGFTFYREALCSLLCQIDEQPVITEAVDIQQALALVSKQNESIDLIVINFDCLRDDFSSLSLLTKCLPRIPLVAFGRFTEEDSIRQAIMSGVSGCISPRDGWKQVVDIITRVIKGEIVLAKMNESSSVTQEASDESQGSDEDEDTEKVHLTPRQLEVLEQIRKGASNKTIARNLNVAEGTVKMHCVAIFRELGVSNRTQAAVVGDHLAATRALDEMYSTVAAY